MILHAPAKVNLRLRIVGKRPDGYHNIETIFERIALFDKITLRSLKNNKINIFCDHSGVPRGKTGLIYRTVSLLKKEKRLQKGVEVKIVKKIPVAAGLGGGSSDAASVLMGLNKLWKLSLGKHELIRIGRRLGADIPFFLSNVTFARATGKGDKIMPLRWKRKIWHLLISPKIKLLSKDIYRAYDKNPISVMKRTKILIGNDLERSVMQKAPLVGKLKDALKDIGLTHSLVSGSGPSIFTIFDRRKEAEKAKKLLVKGFPVIKKKGWQIFVAPTL
ncbi:MAG: 4-(cytidine 5'-diphospho)-2-C-methyl-D-erythritol kinase [Candidatus Omnitrophica bacterium]|nr:4-(cytidine 5'-diphospho)-2-C-methyl-D-erythritol kinase [Candidatus Omnitrophota bacterium]